ncbi:MAG: glycosyltransferase family 2 protein [Alphaproteobacteria bacterium]|nr:glycosyltransferase family 2 protein [Alphaproteobacteria bacterium]
MTGGAPQVSVVIPVHDAGALLADALASVARQGMPELEVLVIDDGSHDAPERWVESSRLPVRLIRQENGGPSAARNVGIAACRGRYVAFLDADDIWPRRALAGLRARIDADGGADVVQGHVRRFRAAGAHEVAWPFTIVGPPRLGFNVGSALFRREVFNRIGPFDETMRTGEDVDIWVKVREAGLRHAVLADTTLLYRRGNGGIIERLAPPDRSAEHLRRWATILHGSLARRRRAGAP